MRLLLTFCFLASCTCGWCQFLPTGPYIPYCADSFAARKIRCVVIDQYDMKDDPGQSSGADSLVFNTQGALVEWWHRYKNNSFGLIRPCDSINEDYYSRCDSAGREIFSASGQYAYYTAYNTGGYVVKETSVLYRTRSAPEITIRTFTYDAQNKPLNVCIRSGVLQPNDSIEGATDTILVAEFYHRYIYKKGRLTEVQYGVDDLKQRKSWMREKYFYSGNEIIRIEYSIDNTRKHTTTTETVWTVRYGYAP